MGITNSIIPDYKPGTAKETRDNVVLFLYDLQIVSYGILWLGGYGILTECQKSKIVPPYPGFVRVRNSTIYYKFYQWGI